MFKPSFGNKMTFLSLLFLIISLLFHYYFTIIYYYLSAIFRPDSNPGDPNVVLNLGSKHPPPPPWQCHSPTPGGALEVWPWTSSKTVWLL